MGGGWEGWGWFGSTELCGHTNFVFGLKLGCDNRGQLIITSMTLGHEFQCDTIINIKATSFQGGNQFKFSEG